MWRLSYVGNLLHIPSTVLLHYLLSDLNYVLGVEVKCCLLEALLEQDDNCSKYCATDSWLQIIHRYIDHAGRLYIFQTLSQYVWEEASHLLIPIYRKWLTQCSFFYYYFCQAELLEIYPSHPMMAY